MKIDILTLDEEEKTRIENEIKIHHTLDHINIIKIYDSFI